MNFSVALFATSVSVKAEDEVVSAFGEALQNKLLRGSGALHCHHIGDPVLPE